MSQVKTTKDVKYVKVSPDLIFFSAKLHARCTSKQWTITTFIQFCSCRQKAYIGYLKCMADLSKHRGSL